MDTKLFNYVSTLAKCGNYASAARELYITPQGLNNAIHRLEESLGVPLFEVGEGSIKLTEYGALFVEHASSVCSEMLDLQIGLNELAQKQSSVIRLGATTGFVGYFGSDAILHFNQAQSESSVHVMEGDVDSECVRRLMAGLYDFALLTDPIEDPSLRSIPLARDCLFVWVNRDNPLSRKSELSIADLDGQDVITVDASFKGNTLLMAAFARENTHPRMHYSNEMMVIYENAFQGKCIGITFRNHAEAATSDRLVAFPIKQLPWGCSICYRADRALLKSDKAFLKYMASLARFYS